MCLFHGYASYLHVFSLMCLRVFSLKRGNAMRVAALTVRLRGHNDHVLQQHSYIYNAYLLHLEIIISMINQEELMMMRGTII